jgi:hypothetical protein
MKSLPSYIPGFFLKRWEGLLRAFRDLGKGFVQGMLEFRAGNDDDNDGPRPA